MKGAINQQGIEMKNYSEQTFLQLVSVSRSVVALFFIFLISGAITGINWLGTVAIFLALISWLIPGIMLISRTPWFALAWLRGMNPIWVPKTSWNELSRESKFSVCFVAVVFFLFAVAYLLFTVAKNLN
jgi:hypothetical protein